MAKWAGQPLDFSLSSKGLEVTGGTNSFEDLRAFIKKLENLLPFLPSTEGPPDEVGSASTYAGIPLDELARSVNYHPGDYA